MEKQMKFRDLKSWDIQCIIASVSILLCIMTAVLGLESLSIGIVMIFAVVCVMGGMMKDWVELCKELVNEE